MRIYLTNKKKTFKSGTPEFHKKITNTANPVVPWWDLWQGCAGYRNIPDDLDRTIYGPGRGRFSGTFDCLSHVCVTPFFFFLVSKGGFKILFGSERATFSEKSIEYSYKINALMEIKFYIVYWNLNKIKSINVLITEDFIKICINWRKKKK